MARKTDMQKKKKQKHEWDQESSSDTDFKWKQIRNKHINEERDTY